MTEQSGIDISNIQGARYNWRSWAGRIQFGMCKATEGLDFIDPDLGNNWDAMWNLQPDHRLPRFAYHYFHPSVNPIAQAEFFTQAVKRHGLLPGDNLVIDLENSDNLPPWQVSRNAESFLHAANGLAPNHRVLVYTYPAFALAGNCARLNPWFLWIANYRVLSPRVPKPWTNWTFWQSGDSPVDTDRFNGTLAQLLAFTRMPAKR